MFLSNSFHMLFLVLLLAIGSYDDYSCCAFCLFQVSTRRSGHGAGGNMVTIMATRITPTAAKPPVSSSFWNDPALPWSHLADPPTPRLLKLIRESPYRGGFEPADKHVEPYIPTIVQGAIPKDLVGSLATNGPGRIRIGETQYGHWFDGDGYVTLLSFKGDGTATFRANYVQTERFKAQEELMKKRYNGNSNSKEQEGASTFFASSPRLAFSGPWTLAGKGRWYENVLKIPTNPSNTATMWIGNNRLFALCEGGHPIELDPVTLDTLGPETAFRDKDGKSAKSFFSAHFSRDFATGDIYNHGYVLQLGPGPPARLNLMKLSPTNDDNVVRLQARHQSDLPFDTFVHDSTLTPNYLVYALPPYYKTRDTLWKFLVGLEPIGKLFEWNSMDNAQSASLRQQCHPTYICVHSKQTLKQKWCIPLGKGENSTMSLYHLVDAHDEVNEQDGSTTLTVRVAEHVPPDRTLLEKHFADQYSVEDGTRVYTVLREYSFTLQENGKVLGTDGEAGGAGYVERDVCKDAAPCEFPIVNAAWKPNQRRKYCWTNALSSERENYLNGIQKIDMTNEIVSPVVTFGEYSYAGPPAFLPKEAAKSEDDGYIVTTVYRSLEHRSDIVILDAATLRQLCTMELKGHIPYQFHGDFLAGFVPE